MSKGKSALCKSRFLTTRFLIDRDRKRDRAIRRRYHLIDANVFFLIIEKLGKVTLSLIYILLEEPTAKRGGKCKFRNSSSATSSSHTR